MRYKYNFCFGCLQMKVMELMKYNGLIIFGEMGSGKDTLADYLIEKDNRIKKYGLGDIIRLIKAVTKVDPNWFGKERGFMQLAADKLREIDMDLLNHYALSKMLSDNLGDFKISKENYRDDLNELFSKIRKEKNVIPIIVGGRTFKDFDYWTERGFLSVGLPVSKEVRIARLTIRDGEEVAKNSDSGHNTEKDVAVIIGKTDVKIDNNGSLEMLKEQADKLLKDFLEKLED